MDLTIKNLRVSYKDNLVINNINLDVKNGSFFTILGKSGSGKSTILKAIAGLHENQEGEITLGKATISSLPAEHRCIAYVFQKPLLFPHLSVADNIAFGPEVHGWSKEAITSRIKELVQLVQIDGLEDRMPNQISGGQQQRAAIARSLALNHKIILLDEPFSSLDPSLREEMGLLVKSIQKKLGLTVIFVTHDVSEAMALSDRIVFLSEGSIIQEGSPSDLYNYPATGEIGDFMGKANWVEGVVTNGQFSGPLGAFETTMIDNGKAKHLIRPHDLIINPSGSGYKVVSCERIGNETITVVQQKDHTLTIIQLKDQPFTKGSQVGLELINDYKHLITDL